MPTSILLIFALASGRQTTSPRASSFMKPTLEKNEMPLPPISRRLTMGVALQTMLGSSSSQNLVNSGTTRQWMGDRRLICTKAWLRQSSKVISAFFASGWLGDDHTRREGGLGASSSVRIK